jgi:tyrosine-protein kinase Etk/Wzc
MEEEVSLYEYWLILKEHKNLILKIMGVTLLMTLLLALFTPNTYQAKTSFFYPLSKNMGLSGMSGILASDQISNLLAALPGFQLSMVSYTKGILQSRTIADKLISQFHLMQYYHTKFLSVAEKDLADNTTIEMSKEGILQIFVTTKNPKLSADLANAYVDAFKAFASNSTLSIAKKQRIDIENQLTVLKKKLRNAEEDMAKFQVSHKTADFTQEDNLLMKAFVDLRVQELSTQIALQTARRTLAQAQAIVLQHLQGGKALPLVSPNMADPLLTNLRQKLAETYMNYALAKASETPKNPELQAYRQQVFNLENSLKAQLKREMTAAQAGIADYLFEPQTKVAEEQARLSALQQGIAKLSKKFNVYPLIELQYLRKERRLRVLEALYTFLSTEYEKARLEEEKEMPDLQILDKAVPPDQKSGPHRLLMLLIGLFIGAFLGIASAFLVESLKPRTPMPLSENGKPEEKPIAPVGETKLP